MTLAESIEQSPVGALYREAKLREGFQNTTAVVSQ